LQHHKIKNPVFSRIEIQLNTAEEKPVNLNSMSPEALDSFMAVMSSLKSLTTSLSSNTIFSIKKGSAICCAEAPTKEMESIYNEIDTAIKGKSTDKVLTTNLRIIQEQLQRVGYNFKFVYEPKINVPDTQIFLHERLIKSKRIVTKRTKKSFEYKLRVVTGFLNQIGGKEPNYHFDYGHGEKITIKCSKEEAIEIKKYLYQNVSVISLCKEWNSQSENTEYSHKIILENDQINVFKQFLHDYYKFDNLISRLELIHDFVYEQMNNSKNGLNILNTLISSFCDKDLHISELKTLLIISKPFKEEALLLETYNLLKTNK